MPTDRIREIWTQAAGPLFVAAVMVIASFVVVIRDSVRDHTRDIVDLKTLYSTCDNLIVELDLDLTKLIVSLEKEMDRVKVDGYKNALEDVKYHHDHDK